MMNRNLINQPTLAPTRKIAYGGSVGMALGVIVTAALNATLPEPVSAELASAVGVICSTIVAYMTRERANR